MLPINFPRFYTFGTKSTCQKKPINEWLSSVPLKNHQRLAHADGSVMSGTAHARASAQRQARRNEEEALHPLFTGTPPPQTGFGRPPRAPLPDAARASAPSPGLRQETSFGATPRIALWNSERPRSGRLASNRLQIANAFADQSNERHNLLRDLMATISPTGRLPVTDDLTEMLYDGYTRKADHETLSKPGQHLRDSFLIGKPGGTTSAALQAVFQRPDDSRAGATTVLLCQLQAMTVRP